MCEWAHLNVAQVALTDIFMSNILMSGIAFGHSHNIGAIYQLVYRFTWRWPAIDISHAMTPQYILLLQLYSYLGGILYNALW